MKENTLLFYINEVDLEENSGRYPLSTHPLRTAFHAFLCFQQFDLLIDIFCICCYVVAVVSSVLVISIVDGY